MELSCIVDTDSHQKVCINSTSTAFQCERDYVTSSHFYDEWAILRRIIYDIGIFMRNHTVRIDELFNMIYKNNENYHYQQQFVTWMYDRINYYEEHNIKGVLSPEPYT